MSLQEIIESFRTGLMLTGLWVLAAIVAGCIGVWLYRSAQSTTALLRRLRTWIDGIVFTLLFTACVLIGGTKTNSPPMGMIMPLPPPLPQSVVQKITEQEIAQGWRLVAETNCEADIYAMPDGITPSFNWHRRGTFGEWARLDLGDFAFPLGTNEEAVTSFSVFNDGRIRPTPRDAAREICAVGVPMLAMQGASRFWVGETARSASGPYQGKVLTWENFFLNADINTPVNAQIELFQNGDFTTRSNALERIYRRVEPFDWDGDGLENTVDPEPFVAGPDAHGTNAEWYNVVCSNVLEAVEGDGSAGTPRPTLSWLDGVNTNAYYFVDVVTTNCLAPIYFTGDRESRLGNPVVVARGGETNHVPLLIGIDYAITSPVPFTVSFPDDGFATVTTNGVANYEIRWPLEFSVSPDGNGGFYTSAIPYDPGGEFSWSASGDGLDMRGASACSYTSVSNWIGFTCGTGGNCGCDGCSVDGTYSVESAEFATPSLWCGCCASESVGTNDPPSAPSVSVSFDKAVVFYEDAYTNAPNDVVAKHSTNVTLTVSAYGGEAGGMLYVSEQNIGKLVRTRGKAIAFPYTAFVPPQSGVSFSIEYEAETHSDSEGDITVTASITPGDGGGIISNSTSTTAVRVQLNALVPAPLDGNTSRHVYGVGETVVCNHWPKALPVSWDCQAGRMVKVQNWFWYMYIPLISDIPCKPRIQAHEESYVPLVLLREPAKYYCANAVNISTNVGENVAGGTGMSLELYIEPRNVSFGNIALEEVPTEEGGVVGYFDNEEFMPYWAHTRERRAGDWNNVGNDNLFLLGDEATMGEELPPMTPDGTLTNDVSFGWREGGIIWTIPLGWNEHGTSGETDPIKTNAVPERQTFTITPNGTLTVIKAGFFVSRGTNTQVRLERVPQ